MYIGCGAAENGAHYENNGTPGSPFALDAMKRCGVVRRSTGIGVLFAATATVRKDFSKVESAPIRELRNLLAATEAVSHDDGHLIGGFNRWKQPVVGDDLRDLELIGLKAEGTGHAAAAGLDGLNRGAGLAEERDFARRPAEDGFVMAMPMHQNVRAGKAARGEVRRFGCKPVCEEPDLLLQARGARIVGKEFEQFVLEDAGAAWFEEDERSAGVDVRGHALEDVGQVSAGMGEQAKIVERAATADVTLRNLNLKAGLRQHGFGGREG